MKKARLVKTPISSYLANAGKLPYYIYNSLQSKVENAFACTLDAISRIALCGSFHVRISRYCDNEIVFSINN